MQLPPQLCHAQKQSRCSFTSAEIQESVPAELLLALNIYYSIQNVLLKGKVEKKHWLAEKYRGAQQLSWDTSQRYAELASKTRWQLRVSWAHRDINCTGLTKTCVWRPQLKGEILEPAAATGFRCHLQQGCDSTLIFYLHECCRTSRNSSAAGQ